MLRLPEDEFPSRDDLVSAAGAVPRPASRLVR